MLNFEKILINSSIIGICDIPNNSSELLSKLEQKHRYLLEIEKMTEKRKCEWLTVRLLLKSILGKEHKIEYLPSGKPYLGDSSFKISISHTKGFAAVIVNPDYDVAIDIEKISPRVQNVKSRFLSEEELNSISQENDLVHLLLHWSAKETVYKIINREGVDFQKHIRILPFTPNPNGEGSFTAREIFESKNRDFCVNYFVRQKYVITIISV